MQQAIENIALDQLSSPPEILLRILREFGSEAIEAQELARLIALDPALSLKLLALANSVPCRARDGAYSIRQCVELLGLRAIKMMAVSASTQQLAGAGIAAGTLADYWRHSHTTAFLCQAIADWIGYPAPEEAYLAGLLHDVGKLALLIVRPAAYKPLFKFGGGDDCREEELRVLGVGHDETGALLARRWGLGPLLVEAIRHHHESAQRLGGASELIKAVALADRLGTMEDAAPGHPQPALALSQDLLGIAAADALKMCAYATARTGVLAVELGIQLHGDRPAEPAARRQTAAELRNGEVQRQLADEVRSATLLDLARDENRSAASEAQLLASIVRSASVLFEPTQAFLFEWDAATNLVRGKPLDADQAPLARLRFPLLAERSLIADALLSKTVTSSCRPVDYDESFALRPAAASAPCMLDQQIIRLADAECMYCAPLATPGFSYGVLVLAFALSAVDRVDGKLRFLAQFARQAAACVERLRLEQSSVGTSGKLGTSGTSATGAEGYRAHAKKIIHEAGNPLGILKDYLKLLDLKLKQGQPAEFELRTLNEEIDRVSCAIDQLAAFPADLGEQPLPRRHGDTANT